MVLGLLPPPYYHGSMLAFLAGSRGHDLFWFSHAARLVARPHWMSSSAPPGLPLLHMLEFLTEF